MPNFLYTKISLQRQHMLHAFWAWLGSSFSLLCIALLDEWYFQSHDIDFLMASFGASAVLVFGAPQSPLAQPRNVLGGHFISAIAGVTCQIFLGNFPMLAACTAVSLAIFLMTVTKSLHPPGGASAMLAVVGDNSLKELGYIYAVTPCFLGGMVLVGVGIFLSRCTHSYQYPQKCMSF